MTTLYVGNLSFQASDDEVRHAFAAYGQVASARSMKDRDTGRSRGFAFVDMPDAGEAQRAIAGLQQQLIAGRPVKVCEARPREDGPRL